ncbi:F protein [Epinotia aporema granulovirus]|uniref:F protein n=1 Tax=Epinotia aporema granulovirus TaxID=166056 RepID=K4ERT4_9BBAC|nr:F protein [Epinotia aporema granulovirus]AER41440.1 F protein [Epinotia aporema granulovirus]
MLLLFFISLVAGIDVGTDIGSYISINRVNASGFHYEFQNKLGFVVNTWTFIFNVDYNVIRDRLVKLKSVNCTPELNTRIDNLLETHDNIRFLLGHKKIGGRRSKRSIFGGTFNFVGRFYKSTIGLMDDTDAELLYEMARRENSTEYRVKMLTDATLQLAEYMKHDDCTVDVKDSLQEIESMLNKIMTGIQMALYNNKLSSFMLHPSVLLEELMLVNSDAETEWIVPPTKENMPLLIHLLNCHVFLDPDDKIMFMVEVPRVDKSKFSLYKPVSIPHCHHNRLCKFLTPNSQYIGFDKKRYVRLDDLSACDNLNDMILCYGSITSEKIEFATGCDINMFIKPNVTHAGCDVRAAKFNSEIFYSLNSINKWLYMVEKQAHIRLTCGTGQYKSTILKGTGIITLKQYCKLKTGRTVLVSKRIDNDGLNNKYKLAPFNFSNYLLTNNTAISTLSSIKQLDYDGLSDIARNLDKLLTKEQTDADLVIPAYDNSNANWYTNLFGNWWWELKFITYAVVIVLIVIFCLYLHNCCCGNSHISLPIFSPKI